MVTLFTGYAFYIFHVFSNFHIQRLKFFRKFETNCGNSGDKIDEVKSKSEALLNTEVQQLFSAVLLLGLVDSRLFNEQNRSGRRSRTEAEAVGVEVEGGVEGAGIGEGAGGGAWEGAGAKSLLQACRASEASPHLPSQPPLIYELDGVALLITDPPPTIPTTQIGWYSLSARVTNKIFTQLRK